MKFQVHTGILAFMTFMPRIRLVSSFINNMSMNMNMNSKRSLARPSRLYSTTNKNSADATSIGAAYTTIFGGDYAGHSATFSSVDGALIRVPDHYVPEAMVEWGQVPSCFECIVSEDIIKIEAEGEDSTDGDADGDADADAETLERNIVTVMPEVGCGLDNLDTMKSTIPTSLDAYTCQKFEIENVDVNVEVATAFIPGNKRRVEYIFVEHSSAEKEAVEGDNQQEKDIYNTVRTRISINLHENNQIKSPIEITKERKTSSQSSRGTIADGGGLDARTVSRLIGKDHFNKPFSDGDALDLASFIAATTTSSSSSTSDSTDTDTKAFSLPGNVLLRYCQSTSSLETSLILIPTGNNNNGTDSDAQPLKRIVVKRTLPEEDDTQGTVEFFEEAIEIDA